MALTSITQDFIVKSGLNVQGTSSPITTSTNNVGTLQVNGGAGFAKDILVGSTATIYGKTNLLGDVIASNNAYISLDATVGGKFTATGATKLLSTLNVGQNSNFEGALNTFTGAIIVTGSNKLSVSGAVDFGSTLDVAGITQITNNTTAASAGGGSGALKVTGGVYVGDNLIVNSSVSSTSTTATNALYVAGGVGIGQNLTVNGPAVFNNDVIFNGPATYVYSTNTVYTDNILELHTPPGGVGATWSSTDGKDIGLRFHYYNGGADKNAALVLTQDTGVFSFYANGAEGTTSFSGSAYAGTKSLSSELTSTTDASNTTSGALQVAGGAGIGLSLYAGVDVSAQTMHVRSLSNTRLVFSDAGHNLVDSASLTWDGTTFSATNVTASTTVQGADVKVTTLHENRIVFSDADHKLVDSSLAWNPSLSQVEGRIAFANTSTNLAGGANLRIAYQSAVNTTAFIAAPTAQDQVLAYNASNGTLEWVLASANNAPNIRGGEKYYIPYQLNTSTSTLTNHLLYNYDNLIFHVDGVDVRAGGNNSGTYGSDNAVASASGKSIGLWSDTSVKLNYSNTNYVTADATGITLTVGADTFKFSNTGTVELSSNTYIEANTARLRSLVAGRVTFANSSLRLTDNADFTFDVAGSQLYAKNITTEVFTATTKVNVSGTAATNGGVDDGALKVSGGTKIAKDLYVGTTATIGGTLISTAAGSAVSGQSQVYLNGATSNRIDWAAVGTGAPAFTTRSEGTKLVLYPSLTGATVDYAMGINAATMWSSIPEYGDSFKFKWYGAETEVASLSGVGNWTVAGNIVSNSATSSTGTTSGALTVVGGAGIGGAVNIGGTLFVDSDTTINADLYVEGTIYVKGASLTGIDTISGSTGTFVDIRSTGTIYANKIDSTGVAEFNDIKVTGRGTFTNALTIGTVVSSQVVPAIYSNDIVLASYTSAAISGSGQVSLDTYNSSEYRTSKYLIQIIDSGSVYVTEISMFWIGTSVYLSEYGINTNNGSLGTFDASIGAGIVTLTFTPNSATAMTIKVVRLGITA